MKKFFQSIVDIFRTPSSPIIEEGQLRTIFGKRYQLFRRLLTANNNALQAMAELEKLYHGQTSYRMADIHHRITTIQINVYKMVANLRQMADGRYEKLNKILDNITLELDNLLHQPPPSFVGPSILPLKDTGIGNSSFVGEKMARLGETGQLGIAIPNGFIITAAATRSILNQEIIDEIDRQLQVIDIDNLDALYSGCASIQQLVYNCTIPSQLQQEIYAAFDQFFSAEDSIAVRSSALGEDGRGISFAGLYTTCLSVTRQQLIPAILQVIASKYNPRAG